MLQIVDKARLPVMKPFSRETSRTSTPQLPTIFFAEQVAREKRE
jgi:hypothetical protein